MNDELLKKLDELIHNIKVISSHPMRIIELPKKREIRWLTIREAARYMRMSQSKIYELMADGRLAFIKIDSKRLIDIRDIDQLMMRNKIDPEKAIKRIRNKLAG